MYIKHRNVVYERLGIHGVGKPACAEKKLYYVMKQPILQCLTRSLIYIEAPDGFTVPNITSAMACPPDWPFIAYRNHSESVKKCNGHCASISCSTKYRCAVITVSSIAHLLIPLRESRFLQSFLFLALLVHCIIAAL